MRLQLLLPKVDPKEMNEPAECVYTDCGSKQVKMHQQVEKALRDTMYSHVEVYRYLCLKCGRTFRVYPKGVSQWISQCLRSRAGTGGSRSQAAWETHRESKARGCDRSARDAPALSQSNSSPQRRASVSCLSFATLVWRPFQALEPPDRLSEVE